MLAVFVAVLGATGYFYMIVPKGFIPDTDNDNFNVNIEAAQGTSYYQMVKYQQMVSRDPGAGSGYRNVLFEHGRRWGGFGGAVEHRPHDGQPEAAPAARGDASATSSTGCVPRSRTSRGCASFCRCRRPSAWAAACRRAATTSRCTVRTPSSFTPRRRSWSACMARMPGLQDVSSDLQIKTPRVNIILDRDRAAALGLNWIQRREHALRRLRAAVRLHHLLADQSVPRAAGDAAAVPDASPTG